MDKKTLIIAQILLTCMMAFCMSGTMILLSLGLFEGFFTFWMQQFLMAWPIAFVFTQGVSRIAFPLAGLLRAKLK